MGDTLVAIAFSQLGAAKPATASLTLHVNPAPPAPVIQTGALLDASQDVAYSMTLHAVGNPAGGWTATPLPSGLTLNSATGVISGKPTGFGDTAVTIGFTQPSIGQSAAPVVLTLRVAQRAPVINATPLPDGAVLQQYSATLTVTNSSAGTWAVTGLPTGYQVNPATGVISAPFLNFAAKGAYPLTINYTRGSDDKAAAPVSLTLHVS